MRLEGARLAVTGGAGFLGRAVCRSLRVRGACPEVIRSRDYDLRDPAAVRRMYAALRPEGVIHLAAVVGGIGANQRNPGRFFYDNAVMGVHLIEEARHASVSKFVQIGTVCAYPKFTPVPFAESALWDGYPEETNAPYGLAKRMLLVHLQAYRKQYGLQGIYLLPVNLYGPGDNFDPQSSHVIPAMIRRFVTAVRAGEPEVTLWGTGRASREFLFVEDCAEAILLATERYESPLPLNLGTGEEIRMAELAARVAELAGFRGRIVWDASRPDGQPRRCLDVTRARQELGWSARTPLAQGLQVTLDWWREQSRRAEGMDAP